MNKLSHETKTIFVVLILWRIGLWAIEQVAPLWWEVREGFLGPTRWANFDGVHYLSIVQHGYFQYEQAFFPLYPLIIRFFFFLRFPSHQLALIISHTAFIGGIFLFYKVFSRMNKNGAIWAIIFLLLFPTSFFFAAVYTESLFFFFGTATLYAIEQRQWIRAGIFISLASATRLFGIFLLPIFLYEYLVTREHNASEKGWIGILLAPTGLIFYMMYLYKTVADPLFFFHAQPAFGAERSGGALILLPQVLWRYAKIAFIASPQTISYAVAIGELISFLLFLGLFLYGLKISFKRSYLLYSLLVLIVPSLTGTLSSMPRYVLSAFPLFFVLGNMHNKRVKIVIAVMFAMGLIITASAFVSGYFVA